MGCEIERKFLVNDGWRDRVYSSVPFKQGYISNDQDGCVRVRIEGEVAKLTIKGATRGVVRLEYEYSVPVDDALEMLEELVKGPVIEKIRHIIVGVNHTWEVDEFLGDNEGLIVAEIELTSKDEDFDKPEWVGQEVSDDKRYYNALLVKEPYKNWKR